MERNITITLEKAREWYNSDDESLKELALQAFNEEELIITKFTEIKTFDAAVIFFYGNGTLDYYEVYHILGWLNKISKASAAMFKLNIIRKALNLCQDLHLTENPKSSDIWYPINPFLAENATHFRNKLKAHEIEVVGKIKNEGEIYELLGGMANNSNDDGLGVFCYDVKVGFTTASSGFLGCASEEIAQHFSKYFGMLIT